MKAVLQRVHNASVTVNGKVTGEINNGYVILLGVAPNDTWQEAERMAEKIKKLRIFPDDNGKINLSIADINGEVLVVSQFTLYADCVKGNRPSFTGAAIPEHAEMIYNTFVKMCGERFKKVACGIFGEHMDVALINDGPFTVTLEM
jgi:D-tyrosyl-tRNA(Tyr) deacylase